MTRLLCLFLCALCWTGQAASQAFPTRPVRVIVPFPPAGAVDILGRVVKASGAKAD